MELAGLFGLRDVPTLSQHFRWTQAPSRFHPLSPSGQLDVIPLFLLYLSASVSQCYPKLSLLLNSSVEKNQPGFPSPPPFPPPPPPCLCSSVAQSLLPSPTSLSQALLSIKSQVFLTGSPIIIIILSARRRVEPCRKAQRRCHHHHFY